MSFSSSTPWNLLGLPLPMSQPPVPSISSVQFRHSVMPDSLQPHGLQHTRLPCPSPTLGAYINSCPPSWWCHPTISSSVIPFSRPQPFPASGSFQMSQFFTSGGQSIRVSVSASVLPVNIQDWLLLGLISFRIDWLNLLAVQGLSSLLQHHSSKASILQHSALWSNSYIHTWLLENHSLD